mmetsp:Transcript_74163/g.241160  ORF Transcript_74163/g.241160 Transcript_74163/m.241160 type:complete len:180 (+) Transcript_74163:73-612(+)|eukprot:CAMPEP_0203944204 /NCGR_PEP_ID=MMETSP0359-20131031/80005_1 /ASSEMBLY_ACC=CAM_ASM_000338 /TAXON_ID=268821 /ORGANISM="Scrippsiella Hangoei, Strain SHTV-5" /LENGTH=179 /DNA_ID=CAMNT_0050875179 /DNA_START=65 /DNA_END=604 /DNA_ORIENTATION=+
MGQAGGKGSDRPPACIVPTSTQIRRAQPQLTSKWWALQAEGKAPVPLCLDVYGKAFSSMLEQHCGKYRSEHQRCIRSRKLDLLNMSAWYPECGEPFEIENACVGGLLVEIDKWCSGPLEKAANAFERASGDLQEARLKSAMDSVGQCVAKVASAKGVSPQYDAEAARRRYFVSKNVMLR